MRKEDSVWIVGLLTVLLSVVWFQSTTLGITLQANHPFSLGFVKFALIAIQGDFIVSRFKTGHWTVHGIVMKMAVWGMIGLSLVVVFPLFEQGVLGVLETFSWTWPTILVAFITSVAMNLWYAPMMMALHRLSDAWIDGFVLKQRVPMKQLIQDFNWPAFFHFTLGKTIPFFWIPAHTLTFMMPASWRVVYAAILGVSLGIFQGLLKRQR